jgi:hypothetical protein
LETSESQEVKPKMCMFQPGQQRYDIEIYAEIQTRLH